MGIFISLVFISLLIGLLFRKKGDGLLDTMQSGCWILLVIAAIIFGYFLYIGSN
jgi:hypothetical protein